MSGGISAAFLAVAVTHAETLLIFAAYLTSVPLFVTGLGAGGLAALTASFVGTAGLYLTGPSNIAFVYALVFGVPAVALTAMSLRYRMDVEQKPHWYPEGNILTAVTIYPCAIFLGLVAMTYGYEGGLLKLTTEAFSQIGSQVSQQLEPEQVAMVQTALDRLARVAPAVVACAWMCVIIVSMVIAQSVLKQQQWNLRDAFALHRLRVPHWLIIGVAVTGLVGVLAPAPFDYIGENLGIILGVPFFLVGLAIVHAWAATTRVRMLILIVFYLLLSVPPLMWLSLVVAGLGVIDQWVDFRRRMERVKTTV